MKNTIFYILRIKKNSDEIAPVCNQDTCCLCAHSLWIRLDVSRVRVQCYYYHHNYLNIIITRYFFIAKPIIGVAISRVIFSGFVIDYFNIYRYWSYKWINKPSKITHYRRQTILILLYISIIFRLSTYIKLNILNIIKWK